MDALKGSIETNIPEASLKTFVRNQLNDLRQWRTQSVSVDGSSAMLPTYSYGHTPLYVMIPDQKTLDDAKQRIAETLAY